VQKYDSVWFVHEIFVETGFFEKIHEAVDVWIVEPDLGPRRRDDNFGARELFSSSFNHTSCHDVFAGSSGNDEY
jgi:hypothetical protein